MKKKTYLSSSIQKTDAFFLPYRMVLREAPHNDEELVVHTEVLKRDCETHDSFHSGVYFLKTEWLEAMECYVGRCQEKKLEPHYEQFLQAIRDLV